MEELEFDGYRARMITTDTRGVGVNRNLALLYAQGEICMFADDDVVYDDDAVSRILEEFRVHPDADIIIFHFESDTSRKQPSYPATKKCGRFTRMTWGAVRIAFRLSSVRNANIWFTTLFGGGCIFPAGEDSMWLAEARKKGLTMYVSKETIGKISYQISSWYSGHDEKYFFGQGAYYQALRPRTVVFWSLYSLWRTHGCGELSVWEKLHWIRNGRDGFKRMQGYEAYSTKKVGGS